MFNGPLETIFTDILNHDTKISLEENVFDQWALSMLKLYWRHVNELLFLICIAYPLRSLDHDFREVLMLWWSVHMCRPKWVDFWCCSIHSGGFLKSSVSKRVKIHEPPFIDRYLNGSVFLLLGIQMGHYFDSTKKISNIVDQYHFN